MRTVQLTFLTVILLMKAGLACAQDNPKWYYLDRVDAAGMRCMAQAKKPNGGTDRDIMERCLKESLRRLNDAFNSDNLRCRNSTYGGLNYIKCMIAKGYVLRD